MICFVFFEVALHLLLMHCRKFLILITYHANVDVVALTLIPELLSKLLRITFVLLPRVAHRLLRIIAYAADVLAEYHVLLPHSLVLLLLGALLYLEHVL